MTQHLQQIKLTLEEENSKKLMIFDTVWASTLFLTMNNQPVLLNDTGIWHAIKGWELQVGFKTTCIRQHQQDLKAIINSHSFTFWKKTEDISWFIQQGSAFSE